MAEQPTGTVTLLFTDIEGSTALLQRLGTQRYAQALDLQRRLLRESFERHGGYEVDCEGDSFFVAFERVIDAVAAAAEAQRALAEAEWPEGLPIRVRMGVHTGEPLAAPPKYVGLDVHKAARIMAAGHGGQVLVSSASQRLLSGAHPLRDLGEHRLKDLSQPEPLWQLMIDRLPTEFPALKTLGNRPTNLPVQPNPLVGRQREIGELTALLSEPNVRLVTLTGTGGTGKTRLALQVAAELLEEFASGVFFVPLSSVREPGLVLPAVAQVLAVREVPGADLAETLARYLGDKQMLLVLDNFEQVLDAASAVAQLLACARLKLLVTSRERLRVRAERVYPVSPLPLADPTSDFDTLAANDAVSLFAACGAAAAGRFALDVETAPVIAQICARLDGLPLAIELAAVRLAALTPQALLARLDRRLPFLTGGSRDADDRQRTLLATIGWSYDLLSAQEQRLFARLSVFGGGCRLGAVEAICSHESEQGDDSLEVVSSLVEKSLLRRVSDSDDEPRYWMLETIREFARGELSQEEVARLNRRRLSYLANLVPPPWQRERYVWELPEFAEIVRAEDANVEDVLRWAATAAATPDDRRHAQLIVACLWTYWFADGRLREGRERAESVLDTGVTGSYTEPGYHALVAAGEFARFSGDWADAEHLKRQAIQLTTDLQEKAGFLSDLGDVLDAQGRDAAALRAHDEAVALRREIGHRGGLAHALINRGRTLLHAGHPAEAEQDTLAASAELDDLPLRTRSMFQSWVAAQLGEIAWYRRQPDLAAGRFREALRQATESYPDYPGVALLLGWIAAVTPDARTAARVLAMSDELRLQRGQPADNATVDAELRQRLAQELTDAERAAEREQALATGPTALIEELLAVAAVET